MPTRDAIHNQAGCHAYASDSLAAPSATRWGEPKWGTTLLSMAAAEITVSTTSLRGASAHDGVLIVSREKESINKLERRRQQLGQTGVGLRNRHRTMCLLLFLWNNDGKVGMIALPMRWK